MAQLRAHVEAMVLAEKYKKPKVIEVPALRREPAAPHATKYAKTLKGEREAKAAAGAPGEAPEVHGRWVVQGCAAQREEA